jgi:hypothetical protein
VVAPGRSQPQWFRASIPSAPLSPALALPKSENAVEGKCASAPPVPGALRGRLAQTKLVVLGSRST